MLPKNSRFEMYDIHLFFYRTQYIITAKVPTAYNAAGTLTLLCYIYRQKISLLFHTLPEEHDGLSFREARTDCL